MAVASSPENAPADDEKRANAAEKPRQVTSYDVARLAGVTQPTVSRAMRGERVRTTTRERVLAAAHSLGYVPSDAGRSLATRRTNRIAIVLADLQNHFYLEVLAVFERRLAAHGYRATIYQQTEDDDALLLQLSSGGIDGVAFTSLRVGSSLPLALRERNIPAVQMNRETNELASDVCVSDNIRGSRLVANLLIELGHRRIGAIFGPADTSTGRDRAAGFRDALAEAGIAIHPAAAREVEYTHRSGHDALIEIMTSPHPPTAVFCANDVLAIGALNAARLQKLSVPHDLTLIGYDDMEMSSWEAFNLTTVRQNLEEMTTEAAELLIDRVEGGHTELRRLVIQPSLVLRSTDAAPRSHDSER